MIFNFINPKIKKSTLTAIAHRIQNGEHRFYLGDYFYELNILNNVVRRRKQKQGYLPTSDWESVAKITR